MEDKKVDMFFDAYLSQMNKEKQRIQYSYNLLSLLSSALWHIQ